MKNWNIKDELKAIKKQVKIVTKDVKSAIALLHSTGMYTKTGKLKKRFQ